MGKLIIDSNSVFEIDEECVKKRKPVPGCDIEKYFLSEKSYIDNVNDNNSNIKRKKR